MWVDERGSGIKPELSSFYNAEGGVIARRAPSPLVSAPPPSTDSIHGGRLLRRNGILDPRLHFGLYEIIDWQLSFHDLKGDHQSKASMSPP